jgi:hypothetical protein
MITIVVIVAAAVFVALITTLVVRDRARARRLVDVASEDVARAEADQARARTDAASGTANRAFDGYSGS